MKQALIVGVALAALVASPAAGRAQTQTNFAGTWTLDQTPTAPAPPARGVANVPGTGPAQGAAPARGQGAGGARAGGFGGRGGAAPAMLTIVQTPAQITIERGMGAAAPTSGVYKLDGSESTNLLGDVFLSRSKVSWDGAKLVITTSKDLGLLPNGPSSEESKEVYSLDAGVLTVVLTTRTAPSTLERTRTVTYRKRP